MINQILFIILIIISILVFYKTFNRKKEHFSLFWSSLQSDGYKLKNSEENKPVEDICSSRELYGLKSKPHELICGSCPEDARCLQKEGEECQQNEDCLYFHQGKAKCCQGVCRRMDSKMRCPKSKLGEKCKNGVDCEGSGSGVTIDSDGNKVSNVVCCNSTGQKTRQGEWGQCTIPRVNSNIGYCPNEANHLVFEKKIGEECFEDTDCRGHGNNVACCQGKCTQLTNTNTCPLSKPGQRCKTIYDCEGHGDTKTINGIGPYTQCCKPDGTNNPVNEWGVCTKSCKSGNQGYCPNQPGIPKCEVKRGESCDENEDCMGHDTDEMTRCCPNKDGKRVCMSNPNKLTFCPFLKDTILSKEQAKQSNIYCLSGLSRESGANQVCM